jgi:hypothetical protein
MQAEVIVTIVIVETKCDRCGVGFEGPSTSLRSTSIVLRQEPPRWMLDLCDDCVLSLQQWIEDGARERTERESPP